MQGRRGKASESLALGLSFYLEDLRGRNPKAIMTPSTVAELTSTRSTPWVGVSEQVVAAAWSDMLAVQRLAGLGANDAHVDFDGS